MSTECEPCARSSRHAIAIYDWTDSMITHWPICEDCAASFLGDLVDIELTDPGSDFLGDTRVQPFVSGGASGETR